MRALLILALMTTPAYCLGPLSTRVIGHWPVSENVELAKGDRLLSPGIVLCMSGTGLCITYRLEPVATFDQCQRKTAANALEVQAKFTDSWIYGFECS
jgi:hypothetical protein